jgi:hypothetical protein
MSEPRAVRKGDWLHVRREMFGRSGEAGEVVDVFDDGVGLDFYCGRDGTPSGLPSIEFWEWGELDMPPDLLPRAPADRATATRQEG